VQRDDISGPASRVRHADHDIALATWQSGGRSVRTLANDGPYIRGNGFIAATGGITLK
jgi:hypothetical protein